MRETIQDIAEKYASKIRTPYYLIDEFRLLKNLEKIQYVKKRSGTRAVLALKCFSTWSVFPLMRKYLEGTTCSSLNEAKLSHEYFGGETQVYSVAFSESDIRELGTLASKIIFNSISQLERFYTLAKGIPLGIRVNPGVSCSQYDLADPVRKNSRLGVKDKAALEEVTNKISGLMFHINCENTSLAAFIDIFDHIRREYGALLKKMKWISLGGGIAFTHEDYPLDEFSYYLKKFAEEFDVQIYLEPGDAAVTKAGYLVTQVQDIVQNDGGIAIINAAVETHMLDNLIYQEEAQVVFPKNGPWHYTIAGNTCLAGDIWGSYNFQKKLKIDDFIIFNDAARYTMVKMNWFNGVQMPSIVVHRLDGKIELMRAFAYEDFRRNLS